MLSRKLGPLGMSRNVPDDMEEAKRIDEENYEIREHGA